MSPPEDTALAVADEDYLVHLSPLDFELRDEQQKSAIYVEGGELSHKLTLAIWNQDPSKQRVVLGALDDRSRQGLKAIKTLEWLLALDELETVETKQQLSTLLEKKSGELKDQMKIQLPQDGAELFNQHPELLLLEGKERMQKIREMSHDKQADFFARNHHLELRFPRGTFSGKARAWVNEDLDRLLARKEALREDVWYIYYHEHSDKKFESLYLLFPVGKTLEAASVASEKPAIEIVLPHIAVDAGNDALVLPVELRPGPLAKGGPDSKELLGARICTVEVLSQLGQKYIPLHFDIVGSNTVLNDGDAKTALLLRITNVDREVSIPIERKGNRQTRFILACEIADRDGHQEWALTDEKNKIAVQTQEVAGVGTIQPRPEKNGDWQSDPITASTNGRMAEWVVDGELLGTDMLKPNDSVYLRLEVQTGLRSGPTDVHLYYRHIAGYWDGSRACTIQKSPLLFYRYRCRKPLFLELTEKNFDDELRGPHSKSKVLQIVAFWKKWDSISPLLTEIATEFEDHVIIGSVDMTSNANLVDWWREGFPVDKTDSQYPRILVLESGGIVLDSFQYKFTTKEAFVSKLKSLALYFSSDDRLPAAHTLSGRDSVGIGTNKPASKLSVTDGLTIGSNWAPKHKAPPSGLLVQGKVGVGTNWPKSRLAVTDGLTIGARWAEKYEAPENGLLVEGHVAIGAKEAMRSMLAVGGGVAVGASWASTGKAPKNGLLVQGQVAIGTLYPDACLTVDSSRSDGWGLQHTNGAIKLGTWLGHDQARISTTAHQLSVLTNDIELIKIDGLKGNIDMNGNVAIGRALTVKKSISNRNLRKNIPIKKKTGSQINWAHDAWGVLLEANFTLDCDADILFIRSLNEVLVESTSTVSISLDLALHGKEERQLTKIDLSGPHYSKESTFFYPSMHHLEESVPAGKHIVRCYVQVRPRDERHGPRTLSIGNGVLSIIQL